MSASWLVSPQPHRICTAWVVVAVCSRGDACDIAARGGAPRRKHGAQGTTLLNGTSLRLATTWTVRPSHHVPGDGGRRHEAELNGCVAPDTPLYRGGPRPEKGM